MSPETPGKREPATDTSLQIWQLEKELAQLDDDLEQGLITEEVFRQISSEKRALLERLNSKKGAG